MKAGDIAALLKAVDHWRKANGFCSFSLSDGVGVAWELVFLPEARHAPNAPFDSYFRKRLYMLDPVVTHSVAGEEALVWRSALWRESRPAYYEFLREAKIESGVSMAIKGADESASVVNFYAGHSDLATVDQLASIRIIGTSMISRLAALGGVPANTDTARGLQNLSGRQMEILKLAADGKTNAEIGVVLGIQRRTVDYHMSEIIAKLGVTSRIQAAVLYSS